MTLYIKPFVRWIWIGTIFIAMGGILAVTDKRYRRYKIRRGEAVSTDTDTTDAGLATPASGGAPAS
jgi:cytochrome c-type biogenesis protein CcmF